MKTYRHGDLLLVQVASIPTPAKRQKGHILAHGEATGHAHRLEGSGTLWMTPDGQLHFRAGKGARVVHEEHATICLPPGDYRVVRQREYRPEAPPVQVVD